MELLLTDVTPDLGCVHESSGADAEAVDPQARRFACTFDGQVYPATFDGLAHAYEQTHYTSEAPWGQLYAVLKSEPVPVKLTPIHRPYTVAVDYVHEAHAGIADKHSSDDGDEHRCFGIVYTTIDGRA